MEIKLSVPGIREVYETDSYLRVNDRLAEGWVVLSVATDPYGRTRYLLGLPDRVQVETR